MNVDLKKAAETQQTSQLKLNELYNTIFTGPTPDLPAEDAKEAEIQNVWNSFNAIQMQLSTQQQVMSILTDADTFLKRAVGDMADAKSASTADLWGVGGTFSEMAERSALSRCQSHVSQVEMLMGQANRMQPTIAHLGPMQIVEQNFMTDVFFDNIFTDLNMRDKIRASQEQLNAAQRKLLGELNKANERVNAVKGDLKRAQGVLDLKRKELQQIRAAAFESLAGGAPATQTQAGQIAPVTSASTGQPPDYMNEAPPSYAS